MVEHATRSLGQDAVDPVTTTAIERLRVWYQEYINVDVPLSLYKSHSVLQEVKSDPDDAAFIESQIQLHASSTDVSQGFCDKCHRIFQDWRKIFPFDEIRTQGQMIRAYEWFEIEAAAQMGCKFCAFLLYRAENAVVLDTIHKIEKRLHLLKNNGISHASGKMYLQHEGGGFERFHARLSFPGIHDVNKDAAIRFPVSLEHLTANIQNEPVEDFQILAKWLSACSDHEHCKIHIDEGHQDERPSRLIQISEDSLRLVLTENHTTLPPYATLSYCWGKEEFIKTTTNNLDAFLQNIPYGSLPKTFQDAIVLSKQIGLEYIWIDALCIIQAKGGEHALDWYRESGRMRFIYGNSHINIAASTGTSPMHGLWRNPPNYNVGFRAPISSKEVLRFGYDAAYLYTYTTHVSDLAQRAWTFQERLLAPRTVYFAGLDLSWECRTSFAVKSFPDDFYVQDVLDEKLVRPMETRLPWELIVGVYSSCQLTNTRDKLPALSGIARREHELSGDTYLAGLWKASLKQSLLWEVVEVKSKRCDPRVPTWSWASLDTVDTPIWVTHRDVRHIEVIDAFTTHEGPDPFGEVSGGEVSLRCTAMLSGHIVGSSNTEETKVVLDESMREFPIQLDCMEEELMHGGTPIFLLPLLICNRRSESFVPTTAPDFESLCEEIKLHGDKIQHENGVIEITLNEYTIVIEEGIETIREWKKGATGLVLHSSGPQVKGRFRRIGWFLYDEKSKDPFQEFIQMLNDEGANTAESNCTEIWAPPVQDATQGYLTTPETTVNKQPQGSGLTFEEDIKPGDPNEAFAPLDVHPGARYVITLV